MHIDSGYSSVMSRTPKHNDDLDIIMQETDQNVSSSPDRASKRKNENGSLAGLTPLVIYEIVTLAEETQLLP
jgi:hypothetical protein